MQQTVMLVFITVLIVSAECSEKLHGPVLGTHPFNNSLPCLEHNGIYYYTHSCLPPDIMLSKVLLSYILTHYLHNCFHDYHEI
jgi:hypothetical protein